MAIMFWLSIYGVHIGATELCICSGDAALCQVTLTTCSICSEISSWQSSVRNILHPGVKMTRSESSVIPFLVLHGKVWPMPTDRVPLGHHVQ